MKNMALKPLMSEKSFQKTKDNKYTFLVVKSATKSQVRAIMKEIYNVDVIKVNSSIQVGKPKKIKNYLSHRSDYKKVILTLSKKNTLDLFEIEKDDKKEEKRKINAGKDDGIKEKPKGGK